MQFPSAETIELVLRNHQHEAQRWPPLETNIPLSVSPRRDAPTVPRTRSRKEREIIDLLLREPLVNAEEIRVFFDLSIQRAKLLVSEANHQRRIRAAPASGPGRERRYPHAAG